MGTTWEVSYLEIGGVEEAAVSEAIDLVLKRIVAEMSTWEPASALSGLNRSSGQWRKLPEWCATVLGCSLAVARATGGACDPTIGPLVNLWGFGPDGVPGHLPSDTEIASAAARCGWSRIEWDAVERHARQPGGMYVDLSAIAKGFAVDRVVHALGSLGVVHCLVEIGGELRGRGLKPDGQPWWVTVEAPPAPSGGMDEVIVALHDLAVATSGDYRRGFAANGRWYSHTIDPRTGSPVDRGLASVTVLHPECMLADAWSTALMALGPEEGIAMAEAQELTALFITRSPDGFRLHESSGLAALFA